VAGASDGWVCSPAFLPSTGHGAERLSPTKAQHFALVEDEFAAAVVLGERVHVSAEQRLVAVGRHGEATVVRATLQSRASFVTHGEDTVVDLPKVAPSDGGVRAVSRRVVVQRSGSKRNGVYHALGKTLQQEAVHSSTKRQ